MQTRPFYLSGEWKYSGKALTVINPYTNEIAGEVFQADEKDLDAAVIAANKAKIETRKFPAWKKYEVLHHISRRITERKEEFAKMICTEAGKPIRFAYAETERASGTFSLAADWVRNIKGEILPLDISQASENRIGIVRPFPIGVVFAISPFNFPLNLVAHKIAPAIASGNAIIHKPASKTPLTALMLAEIISETEWPKEAYSVLPCSGKLAQKLVEDPRIQMVSFTGSPEVGWGLKSSAGKKKVTLELGGDAAVIISSSADLEDAAKKCALGAFIYAGQVCISIQRILVVADVYDRFLEFFRIAVSKIETGDPSVQTTVVGPMIDSQNRDKILEWIKEAKEMGAKVVAGEEKSNGNIVSPLVLENVSPNCKIGNTEAFAPIANIYKVNRFADAIQMVNESKYGLQAGIFTDSQTEIRMAFEEMEVGGIIVNQAPGFRADNMPYGGVKDSGFGREGPEYAIREMMEPRLMVW